jgi:hypothetical protein
MKMKRVTLGFSILAIAILLVWGCKPKTANEEPVADTETQTAIDAMWATFVITDVDQICAFLGENLLLSHFYVAAPGQATFASIRDSTAKALIMAFNKTTCMDGRFREGSIFMYYGYDPISNPNANANSKYYREFGFVGRIAFSEYKVDGWRVTLFNPAAPAYVYNRVANANYDPKVTPLTWEIAGKFLLEHPSDPTKHIVWEGTLTKTLLNTKDPKVFDPKKQLAINWYTNYTGDVKTDTAKHRAIVSYSGKMSGFTNSVVPFQMTVDPATPLVRDFQCFPDMISRVVPTNTPGVNTPQFEEFHPFISGIASFTTGTKDDNKYPRQIYVGAEGSGGTAQCDNTGEVLIKGNSYRINFRK